VHGDANGRHQTVTIDKRTALLGVLFALLLAAGAFAIIGQVTQFGRLRFALGHADAFWLPVCIGGQLLAYVGYVLAYRDAARASGGPRFGLWTTARVVIFGTGASILGASVGGLAVDFWALRRTGTRRHIAARRVLALGTIEWTVLSLYAWTAAGLVLITGTRAPVAMSLSWLVVVPACVVGALWFTAPQRVGRFTDPSPSRARPDWPWPVRLVKTAWERARLGIADAIAGVVLVRHLLSHPIRYHGGAIGYPLYWAGDMLILYASVRAFGAEPAVVPMVLAYATSYVISALPLPAGGAGGIEAGMALALHAVGIPLAAALLGVFVYRFVTFWLPVLPALALLPSVRRLHRTLPTVPHTQPDSDERVSFRPRTEAREPLATDPAGRGETGAPRQSRPG
jgi:uncharacterized membrane protein YbhN (UPF0104 family)